MARNRHPLLIVQSLECKYSTAPACEKRAPFQELLMCTAVGVKSLLVRRCGEAAQYSAASRLAVKLVERAERALHVSERELFHVPTAA